MFEGIVRNHSGSRSTLYLEYEAYEAMALAQITPDRRGKCAKSFPSGVLLYGSSAGPPGKWRDGCVDRGLFRASGCRF